MRRLPVAGLLLVVASSGFLRAEEAVTPRYKLGPDDALVYRTTTSLKQKQTVNEQVVETVMQTADVSTRTLEKVDDEGRLHVQSENERLSVEVEIGLLGKYEFDSEAAERDSGSMLGGALTPLYEALSGAYLWATITPRGEVVDSRGYEELLKDVVKDNPIASSFAAGGSEAGHRASESQFHVTFPAEPISPGDDWQTDLVVELPGIGKVVGKTTYEFEKLVAENGHQIAEFSIAPELGIDLDLEQMGAKMTGRLQTEKAEGRLRFDVTAGRLLMKEETYTIGGSLNLSVADQNLTVPMSQTQTVKIELLEKVPE